MKFIAVENPEVSIGSKLIKHVTDKFKDKKIKTEVLVENSDGLNFLRKFDFKVEKRTEDQFILQYLKD